MVTILFGPIDGLLPLLRSHAQNESNDNKLQNIRIKIQNNEKSDIVCFIRVRPPLEKKDHDLTVTLIGRPG